jgi:hypothetical protein
MRCAAWRLAHRLGPPYSRLVAPCVLREHEGEAGALSARQYGLSLTPAPFERVPEDCFAAAFFDSLIAQQDRHRGNYRWDPENDKLGLIDHGFSFAHQPDQFFNRSVFVTWRRPAVPSGCSSGARSCKLESSWLGGMAETLARALTEGLFFIQEVMVAMGVPGGDQ